MAMLRHRDRRNARLPASLLYSSRTLGDVIYRGELDAMARRDPDLRIVHTLTRERPEGWAGNRRRVDRALLAETTFPPAQTPRTYICGPSAFVETASMLLVGLGHNPLSIRPERFGPSGA
jgi:ferredoxin-NADP reductase